MSSRSSSGSAITDTAHCWLVRRLAWLNWRLEKGILEVLINDLKEVLAYPTGILGVSSDDLKEGCAYISNICKIRLFFPVKIIE